MTFLGGIKGEGMVLNSSSFSESESASCSDSEGYSSSTSPTRAGGRGAGTKGTHRRGNSSASTTSSTTSFACCLENEPSYTESEDERTEPAFLSAASEHKRLGLELGPGASQQSTSLSSSSSSSTPVRHYFVEDSKFPGVSSTVFFSANPEDYEQLRASQDSDPKVTPKMFLKYTGVNCNVVKTAFLRAGFRNCPKDKDHFNAVWASPLKVNSFHHLKAYQKVNHFPGTWELGRKDRLYRNISKMRRRHGDAYDILPFAFELPGDYDEFLKDWERRPNQWYIIKPRSSSRGRGIKLLKRLSDVERKKSGPRECIVQRYIKDPLLINGFKFDLRVYVLVTCFDPLRIYVAKEGLARFATEPYSSDAAHMKQRRCHLTNVSVNKKSKKFVANEDAKKDGEGSKWTLSALSRYLEQERGIDWDTEVWPQVKDLVVKAIIAADAKVNTQVKMHVPGNNCFELYGADIMLDSQLRAWLIEFNTGPALNTPTPLDKEVKSRVVADMFHIVGFTPVDKKKFERNALAMRQNRLTGLGSSFHKSTGTPSHRDTNQAQTLVFDSVKECDLPDIIRETEAENRRSFGRVYERAFPCTQYPSTYHDLFEVQRYNNIIVKRWLISEKRKRNRSLSNALKQNELKKMTSQIAMMQTA